MKRIGTCERGHRMKWVAVAVTALISFDAAHAVDRYVAPNGSASSDCSIGTPCTIQRAANIVNPGDVVLLADGTYTTATTGPLLTISRGGTSTNKVTFKAINKWGAKLSGRQDATLYGVRVEADHVRLEGLDIYEFREYGVYNSTGNFFELVGNNIHHIARTFCSSDPIGKDGYYSQGTHDILIEGNRFNDIGRLMSGENGCGTSLPHNDHALYMSGTNISVRNNIFYNIRSGWSVHLYPSPSTNVKIYGNTFGGYIQDGGSVGHILIWPSCSGVYINNNIFYQPRDCIVHMGNSTTTGEVYNNLTSVAISGIFDISQPGFVIGGNILNANPMFVNVTAAGGVVSGSPDFHVRSGSPAIDAGRSLAEVTMDFDGNRRPQGASYDVGCYEWLVSGADAIRPAGITDLTP